MARLTTIGIHLRIIRADVLPGGVVEVVRVDVVRVDVVAIDVVRVHVGAIDVVHVDVVVVDVSADAVVVVDVVVVDVPIYDRGVDMDRAVAAIHVDTAGVNVAGTGAHPTRSMPAVVVDRVRVPVTIVVQPRADGQSRAKRYDACRYDSPS